MGILKKRGREVILKENGQTYEGVIYLMLAYDKKKGDVLQTLGGNTYWLELMDENYHGLRESLETIVTEELVPICEKMRAVIEEHRKGGVQQ